MKKILVVILFLGATLQGCAQIWKIFSSSGQTIVVNSNSDSTIKVKDTSTVVIPNPALHFATLPIAQSIAYSGNATFTALAADGYSPYSYVWTYLSNSGTGTNFSVSNATTTGNVTVTATDQHGTQITRTVLLTVAPPPNLVISSQPQSVSIDSNSTASFSVVAAGFGALHYAWTFNGAAIGMDASTLTMLGNNVSGWFKVTVSDALSRSIVSDSAHLVFTGGAGSTLNTTFTFSLDTSSIVSIGIYNAAHELIRTMVSGERLAAGSHSFTWDKKDEVGNLMPDGDYTDSVLSNNMHYDWIPHGVGNNSLAATGSSVWTHANPSTMVFPGNGYGYLMHSITEASSPFEKFAVDHFRERIGLLTNTDYQTNYQATTDGQLIYAVCYYPGWYAYALNPATDQLFTFNNGIPLTAGATTFSAIDTVNAPSDNSTPSTAIVAIAVQKSDSLLFIGHLDRVRVYSKGANAHFIREYMMPVNKLACDYDNNLWVAGGSTIKKFIPSAGGVLTLDKTITTNTNPLYLDVSPDNSTVASLDGFSQQVKFYSVSTGDLVHAYGDSAGYYISPAVNNHKLYLKDDRYTPYNCFVAFQPDGKIWIADNGTNRLLRLKTDYTYDSTLTWQQQMYYASVDENDPSKAWMDYRRYTVDYSHSDSALIWDLTANYGARRKASNQAPYYDFGKPARFLTLSNGKEYCTDLQEYDVAGRQLAEVTDTGFRKTGFSINIAGMGMDRNGNYWGWNFPAPGVSNLDLIKIRITGFSGNDPTYGAAYNYDQIVPDSFKNWWPKDVTSLITRFSDDVLAMYDGDKTSSGYHLAFLKHGNGHLINVTQPSLPGYANLQFPKNDGFPNNGARNYAGGPTALHNDLLYTQFRGEGWGGLAALTNVWNVFGRNGLFITQFGQTSLDATEPAGYGQATNINTASAFEVNGEPYIAHNDESSGAKMHFWKGHNKSSIKIVGSVLHAAGTPVVTYPYVKLMDGLPLQTYGVGAGTFGNWTISVDSTAYALVRTGYSSYNRGDNDIYVQSDWQTAVGGPVVINRSLGTSTASNNYKLEGNVAFLDGLSNGINYFHSNCYINLLDSAGKIIAQITCSNLNGQGDFHDHGIMMNNVSAYTDYANVYTQQKKYTPFSIAYNGTQLTFTYNGNTVTAPVFDNTANIHFPSKLQMYFRNEGVQVGEVRVLDLGSLKWTVN